MEATAIQAIFDRDGYIAIPLFFTPHKLGEIRREVERLVENQLKHLPPEHVIFEDPERPETVRLIHELQRYDNYLNDLLHSDALRRAAETVLRGPVSALQVQYYDKPPGANSATPPHQDGIYLETDAAETVELWLALDDAEEDTGCMHYVRGSHVKGLLPHHKTGVTGFDQGLVDPSICEDPRTMVACRTRAGDLLIHNALTIHWTPRNNSNHRQRRALCFIYERAHASEAFDDVGSVHEPETGIDETGRL